MKVDKLTVDQQRQLHDLGWEFEDAWLSGTRPKLEDWVRRVDSGSQAALFEELLSVEVELLSQNNRNSAVTKHLRANLEATWHGSKPPVLVDSYVARFPERADVVRSVFARMTDQASIPEQATTSDANNLSSANFRYHFIEEIARGGAGVVWRVLDRHLQREAAVKVLLDSQDNAEMRQRLEREARICGCLQHPSIVPIHELHYFDDGRPFVSMKLVQGETLSTLLKKTPRISLADAAKIFGETCEAIAFAHEQGIIHRDLKPNNIMVGRFGEVQVMDWGLGRQLRSNASEDSKSSMLELTQPHERTNFGSVFGTLAYMAPEQARGEVDAVDERSDVFSLGAILCKILTGEPPYVASSPENLLQMARQADLTDCNARLSQVRGNAKLVKLARKCISEFPADRPQNAREIANRVDQILKPKYRPRLAKCAKAFVALLVIGHIVNLGLLYFYKIRSAELEKPALVFENQHEALAKSKVSLAVLEAKRLKESKQFDAAITIVEDLSKEIADIELEVVKSEILLEMGKGREGAEALSTAMKHFPPNAAAYYVLFNCLQNVGDFAELELVTTELIERFPDNAQHKKLHMHALLHAGKLSDAKVHYHDILEANPGNSYLRNDVARNLFRCGELDEAEFYSAEGFSIDPWRADLAFLNGEIALEQGRYSDAIQHLELAISLNHDGILDSTAAYQLLARCNEFKALEEQLNSLLDDPENLNVLPDLYPVLLSCISHSKRQQAIQLFNMSVKRNAVAQWSIQQYGRTLTYICDELAARDIETQERNDLALIGASILFAALDGIVQWDDRDLISRNRALRIFDSLEHATKLEPLRELRHDPNITESTRLRLSEAYTKVHQARTALMQLEF